MGEYSRLQTAGGAMFQFSAILFLFFVVGAVVVLAGAGDMSADPDDLDPSVTSDPVSWSKDAYALYHRLFGVNSTYERMVRPPEMLISVLLNLTLVQIVQVNEKDQTMKTSTWPGAQWLDTRLSWNLTEFNITILRVPYHKIWLPDINLVNNVDSKFDVSFYSNVLISYDGTIDWIPPSLYKSSCAINVRYFPYDIQTCNLTFVTWAYDSDAVCLTPAHAEALYDPVYGAYYRSTEWGIIDVMSLSHEWRLPGTDYMYSAVTYEFNLYRKPLFYEVTLIIPVLVLTGLSLLAFYLPSDCCERMTLTISLVIALTMPLLIVSKKIPSSAGSVPLAVVFITFSFIVVSATLSATVIIMNIHWRSPHTHELPSWVRRLFIDILPPYLWLEQPHLEGVNKNDPPTMDDDDIEMKLFEMNNATIYTNKLPQMFYKDEDIFLDRDVEGDRSKLSDETRQILSCVTFIAKQFKDEFIFHVVNEDWKYIAMVLDRLCLITFGTAVIITTIALFLSAPVMPQQAQYSLFRF